MSTYTFASCPDTCDCQAKSARPAACHGWNLFTQADWTYWKASETGLGYALNQDSFDLSSSVKMGSGQTAYPHFDWQSGFRVGIGWNTPYDHWDLQTLWTWSKAQGTGSQSSNSASSPTILPTFIHPNIYHDDSIIACMKAHYKANIHLNILDLDLARQFKTGSYLSLRPHIGIRSLWIHQTHNVTYDDLYAKDGDLVLQSYFTHMTNNFWGLGIVGGLGLQFPMRWNFSLVSNLALSLLYGNFNTSYSEQFTTMSNDTGSVIAENDHLPAGVAVADAELGIRWTKFIYKQRVLLALQGGWEQHMFFNQNQMLHFVDGQSWGNFVQNQGDLYFHGWSASLRLFF